MRLRLAGLLGAVRLRARPRPLRQAAGQRHPENAEILLALGNGTPDGIEGKHISVAAHQGNPVAVDSYRELARWAGARLADLASLFDPSAFIVGGGLSDEGELVLDTIRKSYKRWLVGGNWRPVAEVIAAQLGNEAGLVGAADLGPGTRPDHVTDLIAQYAHLARRALQGEGEVVHARRGLGARGCDVVRLRRAGRASPHHPAANEPPRRSGAVEQRIHVC